MKKKKYPGVLEAEKQRIGKPVIIQEEPDFIAEAPNYGKFPDKTPEEVLVWLNID